MSASILEKKLVWHSVTPLNVARLKKRRQESDSNHRQSLVSQNWLNLYATTADVLPCARLVSRVRILSNGNVVVACSAGLKLCQTCKHVFGDKTANVNQKVPNAKHFAPQHFRLPPSLLVWRLTLVACACTVLNADCFVCLGTRLGVYMDYMSSGACYVTRGICNHTSFLDAIRILDLHMLIQWAQLCQHCAHRNSSVRDELLQRRLYGWRGYLRRVNALLLAFVSIYTFMGGRPLLS